MLKVLVDLDETSKRRVDILDHFVVSSVPTLYTLILSSVALFFSILQNRIC